MAFLSEKKLRSLCFKYLGNDVKISDKAAIYNHELISIGDNSRIDDFCSVSGNVTIGRNVHLAIYSHVSGGRPGVIMEDFSGLAYGCHVFTQSDDYSGKTLTNPTVPSKFKQESEAPVLIKKHAIIGTNSIVFPGVTIEEGTSTGAMSMITKSTKPWSVYIGAPARRLKERSKDLLELEKQYLQDEK